MEKNLSLDVSTPIPKDATALPDDSTLVKVAYSGPNPADYKLPELALFRKFTITMPAIPYGDVAGTVVSTTSENLKPGNRVFGRSDLPYFGAFAEYLIVSNKEGVVSLSMVSACGTRPVWASQP